MIRTLVFRFSLQTVLHTIKKSSSFGSKSWFFFKSKQYQFLALQYTSYPNFHVRIQTSNQPFLYPTACEDKYMVDE